MKLLLGAKVYNSFKIYSKKFQYTFISDFFFLDLACFSFFLHMQIYIRSTCSNSFLFRAIFYTSGVFFFFFGTDIGI